MKVEELETNDIDARETRIRVRVSHRDDLTDRVVVLELVPVAETRLRPWTAGAHITLHLPSGLARQYSLCGAPLDDAYRVAIARDDAGRGGSREAHALHVGDEIEIGGPRNSFPLVDAPRHLLVAGGIGITPISAMAHELEAHGIPFRVALALRRVDDAPLARLLPLGCDVEVVISERDERLSIAELLTGVEPGTAVAVCGPDRMLVEAGSWGFALQKKGSRLSVEHFEASAETLAGIHTATDTGFRVTFARSGDVATIGADGTILEAARALGKVIESSCEEGYCGTCETRVLSGDPDHRDDFLTPDEQESGETMMICVSRCAGEELVLDL